MSSNICDYSRLSLGGTAMDTTSYVPPPPPPPKCLKFERLKQLESAVMIRRSEISALTQRKEALTGEVAERRNKGFRNKQIKEWGVSPKAINGQLPVRAIKNESSDIEHNVNVRRQSIEWKEKIGCVDVDSESVKEEKKRYDISDDPTNPLNNPIMRFVDITLSGSDGCDLAHDVPPGDVGNLCVEFDVVADQFAQHTKILKKAMLEIELQIKGSEKKQTKIEKRIQTMADITGIPAKFTNIDVKTKPMAKRKLSTAPVMKAMRETMSSPSKGASVKQGEETGEHPIMRVKRMLTELRMAIVTTNKELQTAKNDIGAKRKTTTTLQKTLSKKQETENKLLEVFNEIRVKSKLVEEKKEELLQLMQEHEEADRKIELVAELPAITIQPLVKNLKHIKGILHHCKQEDEKSQERVTKAQEYRLAELKRRLLEINRSLSSLNLSRDVEALLTLSWQHEEAHRLDAERSMQNDSMNGSCNVSGSPSRKLTGRRRIDSSPVSSARSTRPADYGMSSVKALDGSVIPNGQSMTASDALALEIALMSQEQLYDVDTIIPPNEKVHPAIYSLFVSEHKKVTTRVGMQRLLVAEKGDSCKALGAKVEENGYEYEEIADDLFFCATDAHGWEEEKKRAVVEQITEQRQYLHDLTVERANLRKEINRLYTSVPPRPTSSMCSGSVANTPTTTGSRV